MVIPKEEGQLQVTAVDEVELFVDEEKNIDFKTNVKATVFIKIADTKIAQLCKNSGDKIFIKGQEAGETTAILRFVYNGQNIEKDVAIYVLKNHATLDNKEEFNVNDKYLKDTTFKLSGINCQIEENKITMPVGKSYITIDEQIEEIKIDSDLKIEETLLSGYTYSIKATQPGSYKLSITINNQTQNFEVKVKENT